MSVITIIMAILVLGIAYVFVIPTYITMVLVDENHHLPKSENAELSINNLRYSLSNLDTTYNIILPGYAKLQSIHICFNGMYYLPSVEELSLKLRANTYYILNLHRDSTFQIFSGHVLDQSGEPVESAIICIEDQQVLSNMQGFFKVQFSVEKQSVSKIITITKGGFQTIEREEVPFCNATFILFQE